MASVYILHSKSLDRFYTGSTELRPEERLGMHLAKHYGDTKFTSAANDWELFLAIECKSLKQVQSIEKHIKRVKSSIYIRNLRIYPDVIIKLKERYP